MLSWAVWECIYVRRLTVFPFNRRDGVPSRFEERIQSRLRRIRNEGLHRTIRPPSGIDLSSNDYLNLASHPLLKRRMADAALLQGCGATGSRLLRGGLPAFRSIEERFAEFKGSRAALYFGSGYAANIGVLSTFIDRTDAVFCDEQNHASLIDGIRLSHSKRIKFRHCDLDDLSRRLQRVPAGVQKVLVTESLFSMDGDFAPLADYAELCRSTGTVLIVDEAHAVGVYGERGSGWVEQTGTGDGVFLTINTAGKALGVAGAFAAGPEWAIDYLVQKARSFIFSTAAPPPVAAALDTSLSLIQSEPERRGRLLANSALVRGLLAEAGILIGSAISQIVPVVLGGNRGACAAAEQLQQEGYDVRAIRPPAVPPNTARLRISINAGLDEATLRGFVAAVRRIVPEALSSEARCAP